MTTEDPTLDEAARRIAEIIGQAPQAQTVEPRPATSRAGIVINGNVGNLAPEGQVIHQQTQNL